MAQARLQGSASLGAKWVARQLQRDNVTQSFNAAARLAVAQTTRTVNDGLRRFKVVCPEVAAVYAKTLTAAVMLSASLKGEERLSLEFHRTHGPTAGERSSGAASIDRVYAEAMALGEVRGNVHTPRISPACSASGCDRCRSGGATDVSRLPAQDTLLSVRRILYNRAQPQTSTVECVGGDVTMDVAAFFETSEQVPTALHLETTLLPGDATDEERAAAGAAPPVEGIVQMRHAGGLWAQRIASGGGIAATAAAGAAADSSSWEQVAERVARLRQEYAAAIAAGPRGAQPGPLATAWASGLLPADVISRQLLPALGAAGVVAHDETVFRRTPVDFHCRCSKERFVAQLGRLGADTLASLLQPADGKPPVPGAPLTTLTCQFCNNSYPIHTGDVTAALTLGTAAPTAAAAPTEDASDAATPQMA